MSTKRTRATPSNSAEPPRLRLKLASAEDVRRELARLYRQARAGRLEVGDASRLANVLQILSRSIETSDLETRLTALEGLKNGRP